MDTYRRTFHRVRQQLGRQRTWTDAALCQAFDLDYDLCVKIRNNLIDRGLLRRSMDQYGRRRTILKA
jgi:hypothetical protein